MYQCAKQTGGGSGKAGDQTKGRVLLLKDAHYICYVVKAAKEKKNSIHHYFSFSLQRVLDSVALYTYINPSLPF